MIEQAERDGPLTPGCTILEPTSGNTGISLAMAAQLKGYRMVCVMPENTSEERRQLLAMWGAEIISSPAAGGSNEAVRVAKEIAAEHPDWVMLYQYGNPGNAGAHYARHRPGDPRRPADHHPLRGRPRHHRHPHGRRPLPAREGPRRLDRRRRAALRRPRLRPAQPRRGLRPRALRRSRCSPPATPSAPPTRCAAPANCCARRASSPASPRGATLHAALGVAAKAAKAGDRADIAFIVADGGWKYLSTGIYTADTTEEAIEALQGQLWA